MAIVNALFSCSAVVVLGGNTNINRVKLMAHIYATIRFGIRQAFTQPIAEGAWSASRHEDWPFWNFGTVQAAPYRWGVVAGSKETA